MINKRYTVQNHTADQIEALEAFLQRYCQACPDAKVASAGLYTYHPGAENGQNVFCVYDEQEQLCGFAPTFPAPVGEGSAPSNVALSDPHHIWTIVLADPEVEDGDLVRALLLERVLARASDLAAGFQPNRRDLGPVRRTRLAADMMVSQHPDIAFLEHNGFERYEGVYVMQHPPEKPIPEIHLPEGLVVRRGKLGSQLEQEQYLLAFNQAFPGSPKDQATLRFLLDSPLWVNGAAISVFTPAEDLIASILVYPAEQGFGLTDDVFVLPDWRGRGLARYLIGEGMKFFQQDGIVDIRLEVVQSNLPAVRVYTSMGYEVINEEVFLGRFLG